MLRGEALLQAGDPAAARAAVQPVPDAAPPPVVAARDRVLLLAELAADPAGRAGHGGQGRRPATRRRRPGVAAALAAVRAAHRRARLGHRAGRGGRGAGRPADRPVECLAAGGDTWPPTAG